MIAADTARTRAYVQALTQAGLCPNHVLLMQESSTGIEKGAAGEEDEPGVDFLGLTFRESLPLVATLQRHGIPFTVIPSVDINSEPTRDALRQRAERVFIYSGVGGQILRQRVLNLGKRFLHVHGGYVPDFKGSTTNYYSLLAERQCGASAIFLTGEIDSGPVLLRRKFAPPPDRARLDHVYDPLYRARVLVDVMKHHAQIGDWPSDAEGGGTGATYFVAHPVLRHIAILST